MLWAVLYGIFPVVGLGAVSCWLRMAPLRRLTEYLHVNFEQRKAAALAANNIGDDRAKAAAVVSMMTGLKTVYRWRDVEQVIPSSSTARCLPMFTPCIQAVRPQHCVTWQACAQLH